MNEDLKAYLLKRTAASTTARYMREIDHFLAACAANQTHPETLTYKQLLNYIGTRREQLNKSTSLTCILHGIKHYYAYLASIGKRTDNPAKFIYLKDKRNRDIQTQDLFTTEELEQLLDRKERYAILKNRNLLIISLLIYQGLKTSEIKHLHLHDLDLKEGNITVHPSGKNNGRTLKLDRPKLLEENKHNNLKNTDILILSKLGTPENGEGINYLIHTQKHLFPNKNLNPITIRQSVIFNLLKAGNDLRIVQVFAGHKTPSSTEKYKQTHYEELKKQVLKHHPLN
jgi:integrase/recombinase XerD